MGSKYTEAQKRATQKYLQEKTDDIRIRMKKGTKERWRKYADAEGQSLSSYVSSAVDTYINHKKNPEKPYFTNVFVSTEEFGNIVDFIKSEALNDYDFNDPLNMLSRMISECIRDDDESEMFFNISKEYMINEILTFSALKTIKYLNLHFQNLSADTDGITQFYEESCEEDRANLYLTSVTLAINNIDSESDDSEG